MLKEGNVSFNIYVYGFLAPGWILLPSDWRSGVRKEDHPEERLAGFRRTPGKSSSKWRQCSKLLVIFSGQRWGPQLRPGRNPIILKFATKWGPSRAVVCNIQSSSVWRCWYVEGKVQRPWLAHLAWENALKIIHASAGHSRHHWGCS